MLLLWLLRIALREGNPGLFAVLMHGLEALEYSSRREVKRVKAS